MNNGNGNKNLGIYSRRWDLFWRWLISLISVSILIAVYFFWNTLPPPFSYTESTYHPLDPELCPGDTLEWMVEVDPIKPPYTAIVNRGLYSVSEQVLIGSGVTETVPILYENERYKRGIKFQLPVELPPGKYEVHNIANTENSTYRGYLVAFSVLSPEECE